MKQHKIMNKTTLEEFQSVMRQTRRNELANALSGRPNTIIERFTTLSSNFLLMGKPVMKSLLIRMPDHWTDWTHEFHKVSEFGGGQFG